MKGLFALTFFALTLFAVAGCSYTCNCPAEGCDHGCDPTSSAVGEIVLPSAFPAVASISADSPCSADYQPSASRVLVSRPGAGNCSVHVQFVGGSDYAAQVRFSKVDGQCGCYLGAYASALEPTDAGENATGR